MLYTVTEFEPGRTLALEGGNRTVRSCDQMTFERTAEGGTSVTYTVDIHLTGLARAGTPLLPVIMKKITDEVQTVCAGNYCICGGAAELHLRGRCQAESSRSCSCSNAEPSGPCSVAFGPG